MKKIIRKIILKHLIDIFYNLQIQFHTESLPKDSMSLFCNNVKNHLINQLNDL